MKRADIIAQFKAKARELGVRGCNFNVWTCGRSRTIHVSCRHVSEPLLKQAARALVALHRGVVYASVRVGAGGLSGVSYSSFCFKLGCSPKTKY